MRKEDLQTIIFSAICTVAAFCCMFHDWNGVAEAEKVAEAKADAYEAQWEQIRQANTAAVITPEPTATPTPEPTATPVPTKEPKQYRYIKGCGLSKSVQREIFDICQRKDLSFEFVMAVIYTESSFRANCVSDNGESVGLMQIQERWHKPLMDKLGVDSLYNPVGNVKVGTSLLASYFKEKDDTYYVLMWYNGGKAYADRMAAAGSVSDYAKKVLKTAAKYERQNRI